MTANDIREQLTTMATKARTDVHHYDDEYILGNHIEAEVNRRGALIYKVNGMILAVDFIPDHLLANPIQQ